MIPTYNQGRFIREAIESALSQTYPVLEVVVGDDASSDDTYEVVGNIKDIRLQYIRNPVNLGRTNNYRNLLQNHATGDYVVNLDGDDYFTDPSFIADAVKLIGMDQNVVMVLAKVTTKSPQSEYVSEIPAIESATGLQILKELPQSSYIIMHMGALYVRKIAIEIDFYRSAAISSDWESLYRLTLRGTVKYLDRSIGVWRVHGGNETGTKNIKKLLKNLTIWPLIYKDAIDFGMSPIVAKFICAKCVAFFAHISCVTVSKSGNKQLANFIWLLSKKYKLPFLIIFLTPKYAARVAAGFLGYYRRKLSN